MSSAVTGSKESSTRLIRGGLIWLLALLLFALGGAWALHGRALSTVITASASESEQSPAKKLVVVPGKVEPEGGLLHLAFDVLGVIRKLSVEEGDWVPAGTILAELVNDELRAREEAARFDCEQARARLAMLKNGPRVEDVDEARAAVEQDKVAVEYFEKLLPGREDLRSRQAIALEELLDFKLRAEVARRQHDVSAARLKRCLAGARGEEIEMAAAAERAAAARQRELAAAVERTRLRAPRDGKILRVLRREGESVMGLEALPVLLMADTRKLQIRAEVDESQYLLVKPGQRARVVPHGVAGVSLPASVKRLNDIMGRKELAPDDPREKVDIRVREVILTPEPLSKSEASSDPRLLVQQRVDVTIMVDDHDASAVEKAKH